MTSFMDSNPTCGLSVCRIYHPDGSEGYAAQAISDLAGDRQQAALPSPASFRTPCTNTSIWIAIWRAALTATGSAAAL